jgi:hypothetical protein
VFSTDDLAPIEVAIGRPAIEGHRRRPDGTELRWKQVGVKSLLEDPDQPFYIQWLSALHPSADGTARSSIQKITFSGATRSISPTNNSFAEDVLNLPSIEFDESVASDISAGIESITFSSNSDIVTIN